MAGYSFAGLPTDPCNVVTAISATSDGQPDGAGWAILAFNADTGVPIGGLDGNDGFFQQFGSAQGFILDYGGLDLISTADQPLSGRYAVSYDWDPADISLPDLAAGHFGLSAVVLNAGTAFDDTLHSLTVTVTVDDAACTQPTSTTTTTTAPTTTAPTTTTAAAQPQALTPTFTG